MVIDESLPFFPIDTLDSYIKSVESTVFAHALQEIKHEGVVERQNKASPLNIARGKAIVALL